MNSPPWLKIRSTGADVAGAQNVRSSNGKMLVYSSNSGTTAQVQRLSLMYEMYDVTSVSIVVTVAFSGVDGLPS